MTVRTKSAAVAVVERILHDGFARGDVSVVDELCSPDLVEHQFGMDGTGAAALANVRDAIRQVHAAIPDITYEVEDFAESGDTVWVRAVGRGTATGPFFGPPTGRPIELTVIDIARIVDGRLVEHWGVPDRFAILAQTGALERLKGR